MRNLLISTVPNTALLIPESGFKSVKNFALKHQIQNQTFSWTSTDAHQPVHTQQTAGPGPVTVSTSNRTRQTGMTWQEEMLLNTQVTVSADPPLAKKYE